MFSSSNVLKRAYGFPKRYASSLADSPASSMYAHWDFSDSANRTLVSTKVSQLTDKSGHGLHLVQGTDASRPTLVSADQNGLDVGEFSSSFMSVASVVLDRFAQIIVCRGTGTGFICEHSADMNSNDGHYIYTINTNSAGIKRGGGEHGIALNAFWASSSVWQIIALMNSTKGFCLWVNGVLRGGPNLLTLPSSSSTNKTLYVGSRGGASLFYPGKIAEMRLWNQEITEAQLLAEFTTLNAKWAVY